MSLYDGERDVSIFLANPITADKLFRLGTACDVTIMFTASMDNAAVYDVVLELEGVQARCEADAGVGNCP